MNGIWIDYMQLASESESPSSLQQALAKPNVKRCVACYPNYRIAELAFEKVRETLQPCAEWVKKNHLKLINGIEVVILTEYSVEHGALRGLSGATAWFEI